MNPETPNTPQEELEIKITALLLGELDAAEADRIRQAIAADGELTRLHDQLQQTLELVKAASAESPHASSASDELEPLRLPDSKRSALLAQFKIHPIPGLVPSRSRPMPWYVPVGIAAVLMIMAAAMIPNFTRARNTSASNAVINNLRQLDGAKLQWAEENQKSPEDVVTIEDLEPYLKPVPESVLGEDYIVGKVAEPVSAELDASQGLRRFGRGSTVTTEDRTKVRVVADDGFTSHESSRDYFMAGEVASRSALLQEQEALPPAASAFYVAPALGVNPGQDLDPNTLEDSGAPLTRTKYNVALPKQASTTDGTFEGESRKGHAIVSGPAEGHEASWFSRSTTRTPQRGEAGKDFGFQAEGAGQLGWAGGSFGVAVRGITAGSTADGADAFGMIAEAAGNQVVLPSGEERDSRHSTDANRNLRWGRQAEGVVVGDPEWVGTLSSPDAAQGLENRFVAGYQAVVAPDESELDVNRLYSRLQQEDAASDEIAGYRNNLGFGTWSIGGGTRNAGSLGELAQTQPKEQQLRERYFSDFDNDGEIALPAVIESQPTTHLWADASSRTDWDFSTSDDQKKPAKGIEAIESLAELNAPVLGDLPTAGRLFRAKDQDVEQVVASAPAQPAGQMASDDNGAFGNAAGLAAGGAVGMGSEPSELNLSGSRRLAGQAGAKELDVLASNDSAPANSYAYRGYAAQAAEPRGSASSLGRQSATPDSAGGTTSDQPVSANGRDEAVTSFTGVAFGDDLALSAKLAAELPAADGASLGLADREGLEQLARSGKPATAPVSRSARSSLAGGSGGRAMGDDELERSSGLAAVRLKEVTAKDSWGAEAPTPSPAVDRLAAAKSGGIEQQPAIAGGTAVFMESVDDYASVGDAGAGELQAKPQRQSGRTRGIALPVTEAGDVLVATGSQVDMGGTPRNDAARRTGGLPRVETVQDGETVQVVTKRIDLNYASPANVKWALESILTDERSKVVADTVGGQLQFLGTEDELKVAENLVSALDTPSRQVLIEASLHASDNGVGRAVNAPTSGPEPQQQSQFGRHNAVALPEGQETEGLAFTKEPGSPNVEVTGISTLLGEQRALVKLRLPSGGAGPETIAVNETVRRQADTMELGQKKQELEHLIRARDLVETKIYQEQVDVSLPKTALVQIVDRAQPESSTDAGVLKKLGRAFGSDVQAVARIKVARERGDVAEMSGGAALSSYDPYFIQTEQEVIQSEDVLEKALSKLADKSKSNRDQSMSVEELKSRIDLDPVKNTSVLNIKAKSADPQEAADIANAVAEAYLEFRFEQNRDLALGGIRELGAEQKQLVERVNAKQAEVDRLREQMGNEFKADPAPLRKPSADAPTPQPEVLTADNAFSTFSLNVSDVSFNLAAASLEKGQMPDMATLRSEEFINAFDYRDPAPAAGQPLSFAWERARYPFAHNRDLLRFSVQTAAKGREPGRPLNLVLLLDNSGSMERADRVGIIHECLNVLSGQLTPQDKVSVVAFARTARLWVDGVPGVQAAASLATAGQLTPEGGTNLEEAMQLAYATAERHYLENGVNRVVLLTDGAANLGNVEPESLKAQVEAQRKQGIALDCFGIGWEGYNDDLLEVLSRNGDGRYGFVNTPQAAASEFAAQLAGALQVAASDVKVQVEFNPARVTAYRQIGYAKHQLKKEQFRDNTVDAAEIGAAESGNALYVVETNPQGQGPVATVRARFKVPATGEYKEYEWTVPYSGESIPLENATETMRLAATASAFSEWLAASPYAGEVSPDRLLNILRGAPEVFGADPRPKKLEGMIREAARLVGN